MTILMIDKQKQRTNMVNVIINFVICNISKTYYRYVKLIKEITSYKLFEESKLYVKILKIFTKTEQT